MADFQSYRDGALFPNQVSFPVENTPGDFQIGRLCVVVGIIYAWDTASTNHGGTQQFWQPQATQGYVDAIVASEMTFKGGYDAATNTPDLDTAPSGIAIGDTYVTTVAGTFFTQALEIGDTLISKIDNPTVLTDWVIVSKNYDFGSLAGQIPDIATALAASSIMETNGGSQLVTATKQTGYNLAKATTAEINTGTEANKVVVPDQLQASKYLDQSGSKIYIPTSGTNTYTATVAPAITAYAAGQEFVINIGITNTGASTLNLNGLGAKSLLKRNAAMIAGDLQAGGLYLVVYDGTNFQVLSSVGTTSLATVNARAGADFSVVNPAGPQVTTASGVYTVIARFIFAGTTAAGTLAAVKAIFWRSAGAGSTDMRIYDVTNALQIAELTGVVGSSTTIQNLGAIANLPTGESTFEAQLRAPGAATAAFSTLKLEY